MVETEPLKNATLGDFIRDNSTLVSSFAAFVALTAFSFQLDNPEAKIGLSAAALLGALVVCIELFSRPPARPHQWRLALFSYILICLFIMMGWYWFSRFKAIWVTSLLASIPMVLVLSISVLLTFLLREAVKISVRVFKGNIDSVRFERISQFAFLFFLAASLASLMWVLHRINGHQFQIKLPWAGR